MDVRELEGLALDVLEPLPETELVPDAVVVLELVIVDVPVAVNLNVFVIAGLAETDGLADDVFEGPSERDAEAEADCVFDGAVDFVPVGELDDVLDVETELVPVLVRVVVRVDDVEPVVVRDANIDCDGLGELDEVFDTVAVFVDVRDGATVIVRMAVGVVADDACAVCVRPLVRVDVLLDVPLNVGAMGATYKLRSVVIFSAKLGPSVSIIKVFCRFPLIETRLANKNANENNRILFRRRLIIYI
jgi:hypothetical protein